MSGAGHAHHLIRRRQLVVVAGAALVLALAVFSLTVGPFDISTGRVLAILFSAGNPAGTAATGTAGTAGDVISTAAGTAGDAAAAVVWGIRFPRALLAVFAGGGLALAGAVMQGVFRNPLADPGIIGVSAGGAVGAVSALVLAGRFVTPAVLEHLALWLAPAAALAGACAATALIYRLSLRRGQVDVPAMLLCGIAVNAASGAFIGLVNALVATAEEVQTLAFWTLGSLGRATWELLAAGALFLVPPLVALPFHARALNALALGEEDAAMLGVNVPRVKRALIALSCSLTGATVALCGMLGFVPLVAPHIARLALGADHRLLLPASALAGAALLLAADMTARVIVAPAELPVGIVTSLLGAPVFLSLIAKRRAAR